MKYLIFSILALICFALPQNSFSQQGWRNYALTPNNEQESMLPTSIYFINQTTGFTSGQMGIHRTTDNGASWQSCYAPNNPQYGMVLYKPQHRGNTIFIPGGEASLGCILRSTDAGISWENHVISSDWLYAVVCKSNNDVFVLGSQGTVLKSTDGGDSWQNSAQISFPDAAPRFMIENNGTMYAMSESGECFASNDGIEWAYKGSNGMTCKDFIVSNNKLLVAGAYHGAMTVGSSTNAGLSWDIDSLDRGGYLSSISFSDNLNGYASGGRNDNLPCPNKVIYRTVDGGMSWLQIYEEERGHVTGCYIKNDYVYFSAVEYSNSWDLRAAVISHEIATLGVGTIEGVVEEYSLGQNYPNPFNPTTKINFSIPKAGLIDIAIYDLLGRKVQELVHETKAAGNYTVDFNGSNLASGIYFYTFQMNGFTDTKKMMLIK